MMQRKRAGGMQLRRRRLASVDEEHQVNVIPESGEK